jgi:hypothetical protein
MSREIKIEEFLTEVRAEAMNYKQYSTKDFDRFEADVYSILNNPNATQDCCVMKNDGWYIVLQDTESAELTAENFILAVQDGELEGFAARVVQGN